MPPESQESLPDRVEQATVSIKVSQQLLDRLEKGWSEPLIVRAQQVNGEWYLVFARWVPNEVEFAVQPSGAKQP